MWSNCFLWAHWRERQLWREWERRGRPLHMVPCIQRRPSRSRPYWTRHWVVGWWCYQTRQLADVEAFVPDHRRQVPWWLAWTRLVFKGHVKRGDDPSPQPPRG